VRHRVFRPPYCYRWAVLITAVATAVALAVVAVQASAADPPAGLATPLPTTTVERVPADLVRHTAQAGRVVALTFDDGPHTEYTRQVLDLLARYGAVATFCIVGVEAARHPELVRAVAAAGMALCSHTVNHDGNLPARTDAQIEAAPCLRRRRRRRRLAPPVHDRQKCRRRLRGRNPDRQSR